MRPFWKCLIFSKILVRTKLKLYSFCGNWDLISLFRLVEKGHISSVLLTIFCSMRPFWKYHIISKILVKASLKFHPFEGGLGTDFYIWTNWPKIEKDGQKLRSYSLLGVLNTLLTFCYPGETDFDKKPHVF